VGGSILLTIGMVLLLGLYGLLTRRTATSHDDVLGIAVVTFIFIVGGVGALSSRPNICVDCRHRFW
jgi:FtsH-binding integral membrane protein